MLMALCFASCSRGPSDEEIRARAVAALGNDGLQVTVLDGELTIAGTVPDDVTRLQAFKTAATTPGVKKVIDTVQVQPPPPPTTSSSTTTAPPPRVYSVPAGASVRVVMLEDVDSSKSRAGQTFRAALSFPLTSGSEVVVPEGTEVQLMLHQVRQSGKLKGSSLVELALKNINYLGTVYELKSSKVTAEGESRGSQSTKRIGIATGAGAVVGALVGKGKGALIGGAIGAAGSTTYQLVTSGPSVRVPARSKLDFTLQEAVTFTLPPKE